MAENITNLSQKYSKLLQKSKTAYSPGAEPTENDVYLQRQQYKAESAAEKARNEYLKEQWYPQDTEVPQKKDDSWIGKGLKALSTPLYAVTGAVESVLGKGRKAGLIENMFDNIEEQGTMGDLIRSYGVDQRVAMPLGFALDVAFDPLTWATAGTSALIPRTALGAVKAAQKGENVLEGARLGAESNLLHKAAFATKTGEGVKNAVSDLALYAKGEKKALQAAQEARKGSPSLSSRLTQKAEDMSSTYNTLTDNTLEKITERSANKKRFFSQLYDKAEETEFGRSLNKFFALSNTLFHKKSMEKETANAAAKQAAKESAIATTLKGDPLSGKMDDLGKDVVLYNKTMSKEQRQMVNVHNHTIQEAEELSRVKQEIAEEMEHLKRLASSDEILKGKLADLTAEERESVSSLFRYYKSEVDAYDKRIAKILMSKRGREVLNGYGVFIGWFKNSKIGGNILGSATTNSLVGNLAMTSMMGVDVFKGGFMQSLKEAGNVIARGKMDPLRGFLTDDQWVDMLRTHPENFEKITGLKAEAVLNSRKYMDDFIEEQRKLGNVSKEQLDDLAGLREEAFGAVTTDVSLPGGLRAAATTTRGAVGRNMLTEEVLRGPYAEFLEKVRLKGEAGNKAAELFYKASTVSLDTYGKLDQTYRLGMLMHLSQKGISLNELKTISNRIVINLSDVQKSGNKYLLSPAKAMEIAQETYMNYDAMPGFVRIMRTLPLLGSPFMSFSYGMMAGSAKTLLYNPSFYNKTTYLLKEISGQKSPLEKQALESKYYQWLDQPDMMKLPFFQKNPVYLNMGNMLPHYSMSLFSEAQRSYQDRFGSQVASLIDKSPFFKTPEGQVMLDYIILPSIIQDEMPQGMFGQQLYRKDAGNLEKVGSATRNLMEALVPTNVGYLGTGTAFGVFPESAINSVPSYGFRKAANASLGRNVNGISTDESALERTNKVMFAMMGFPYYSVKLQYADKSKKK